MISWIKRCVAAPGEVDRLRERVDELLAVEKWLRAEIDTLNTAVVHWRRLAGALLDCNASLDERLAEMEAAT